jgi:hypothetical protein
MPKFIEVPPSGTSIPDEASHVGNGKPPRAQPKPEAAEILHLPAALDQYPEAPVVPWFRLSGRRGGIAKMEDERDRFLGELEAYVPAEQITRPFTARGAPGKIIHPELQVAAAHATEVGGILVAPDPRKFLRPQQYDRWDNRDVTLSKAELKLLRIATLGVPLATLEDPGLQEDGTDGYHGRRIRASGKAGRPRKGDACDGPDGETYAERIFAQVIAIEIDTATGRLRWHPPLRKLQQWCKENLGPIGIATLAELPWTPSPWGPLWEEVFEAERQQRERLYGHEVPTWLPDDAIAYQGGLVRKH